MGDASVAEAARRIAAALGDRAAEVERELVAAWARAHRAYPDAKLAPEAFFEATLQRVGHREPISDALRAFPAQDLLLVLGCAARESWALVRFESDVLRGACANLGRLGLDHAAVQDVRQEVLVQLLVERPDRPLGLLSYSGRSTLATWLRVVVGRACNRRRSPRRLEVAFDEHVVESSGDFELSWLKHQYRVAFRQAFGSAIAALPRAQRSLLRLKIVDGFTLDKIANIYHWSRSRVARELEQARGGLRERTRSLLCEELDIDPVELGSIMALIASHLDASVGRALAERPHREPSQ